MIRNYGESLEIDKANPSEYQAVGLGDDQACTERGELAKRLAAFQISDDSTVSVTPAFVKLDRFTYVNCKVGRWQGGGGSSMQHPMQ